MKHAAINPVLLTCLGLLVLIFGSSTPVQGKILVVQQLTPTPMPADTATATPTPSVRVATPTATATYRPDVIVIQERSGSTPDSQPNQWFSVLPALLSLLGTLCSAVTWPIAALLIMYYFRTAFKDLLTQLTSVKWGSFEASFRTAVSDLTAKAEEAGLSPAVSPIAGARPREEEPLFRLAAESSRGAVLEAWIRVEQALKRLAEAVQIDPRQSLDRVTQELARLEMVRDDIPGIIHELRALRNQAAHFPDFALTRDSARGYIALALEVQKLLEDKLATARPDA